MTRLPDHIENAIHLLSIARQLDAESKSLKSAASEILIEYMTEQSLQSLESEHCQSRVTYTAPSTTKRFKQDKAKQNLLSSGVSADVIQSAFDSATETSERAGYVSLKPLS